jgi:hypothetical protein
MVKNILIDCGVSVVFSDADNVFLKDPFQHDLGHMFRMSSPSPQHRRYDYIYQQNNGFTDKPRTHGCMTEGKVVTVGNTGFHYLRSSDTMITLLEEVLVRCDIMANDTLDDQYHFWRVMGKAINKDRTWEHCPHDYRH